MLFGAGETNLPENQVEIRCIFQSLSGCHCESLSTISRFAPGGIRGIVDTNVSGIYTVVLASPRKIR